MTRIAYSLILLIFISTQSFSQFKTIAEGPLFEEPEEGQVQILPLSNGNTLFVHFKVKKHFSVSYTLYDSSHKIVKENSFALNKPDKQTFITSPVEFNNDIVISLYTFVNYAYQKMRVVIDGSNGNIKAMDNKPDIMKPVAGLAQGKGLLQEDDPFGFLLVDPSGNSYSVFSAQKKKGEKLSTFSKSAYDADYNKTQTVQYQMPRTDAEINNINGGFWINKKDFAILFDTYNPDRKQDRVQNKLFLSLGNSEGSVSSFELDFINNRKVANSLMEHDPISNRILLLTTLQEDGKNPKYFCYLSVFSLSEKKFVFNKIISPEIIEKSISEFGKEIGQINIPSALFVNNDGTFQIIFEKHEFLDKEYSQPGGGLHYSSSNTFLGNLAIVSFDKNGNQAGESLIPKAQYIGYVSTPPFRNVGIGNFQELRQGNQFKGYSYFNETGTPYIFINDIPKNAESAKKGKLTTIKGVNECVAYTYNLTQTGILTDRNVFFEKELADNYVALFSASGYDPKRKILVTMKVRPEQKGERARLVWLQPK